MEIFLYFVCSYEGMKNKYIFYVKSLWVFILHLKFSGAVDKEYNFTSTHNLIGFVVSHFASGVYRYIHVYIDLSKSCSYMHIS